MHPADVAKYCIKAPNRAGSHDFILPEIVFDRLFSAAKRAIFVDEKWYLQKYPDVAAAIANGDYASASDHFSRFGYAERRMPYRVEVDENFYLSAYPDVAEAVRKGAYRSGQQHFEEAGFSEGRHPYPNFSLF
jgi:hypothetical protein